MSKTAPVVTFGLYAMIVKQDSAPAATDIQPFAKISDLKTGNTTNKPTITLEPDFWLLDGNYKFRPSDALTHVGLMSMSMSNADGNFITPPVLTVTFSEAHTTDSLTLRFAQFSDDYSSSVRVQYFDAADTLIRMDSYNPIDWEFSTEQAVTGFKKIVITFYSTNKPYRYLRLLGIDYGRIVTFTGADIKSASVVEQVNPLSIELPVDTLELHLYSSDAAFSIIAPGGDYASLQNKQPMDVYETIGNDTVYIGQFYLDTWENPSDTEIVFKAIDMIGVLDTIPYLGGIWTTATTVGALVEAMLSAINVPYALDPALEAVAIKGWIPICSTREALQQIAFACGAFVTCSRSSLIQITKTILAADVSSYDSIITKAEKGMEQSLTLTALVTGVEVTAHNYLSNATSSELYNGTLTSGAHTITFSAPMHSLSISGATITASGANYAIVSVATTGTVLLTGQGYTDTLQVYGVYNTGLDANVKVNIPGIKDATLVNSSNVASITQQVYNYYQQRYLQRVKLYNPTAEAGKTALVDALYNRQIAGIVEKLELDLSGGFTAKAEINGVVVT